MKILIVEDEKGIRDLLVKRLKKHYSVDACEDGESALDYIRVYIYDAIVLDIMLPKIDGIQVLKHIRNAGNDVPVIMLTAKGEIEDRVAGLDAGADDYLIKPFAFDELLARLRVMTRRKASAKQTTLSAGDLILDTVSKTVTRAGNPINLTAKEYMLLEYMMLHPNITLTRNQLEQQAWNSRFEGGSNIIDVYIRYLRKKIDTGYDVKRIKTVYGMGYRLEVQENEKEIN
ncbi:MAG TPA: response regulator transcription factor [Candidatus Fimousia stercorigallinarum]|nr:response regulator transcription factor [Candidatus Fimousia stercorigallinarum]